LALRQATSPSPLTNGRLLHIEIIDEIGESKLHPRNQATNRHGRRPLSAKAAVAADLP